MTMRLKCYFAIGAAAVALALFNAAVAQSGSTVSVQDNLFSPTPLQVSAGTTVVWSLDGGSQHTVTLDDGSSDSGPLDPGTVYSLTFSAPGTYAYYCNFHGAPGGAGMAGVIAVS
jgi:plastocyanin